MFLVEKVRTPIRLDNGRFSAPFVFLLNRCLLMVIFSFFLCMPPHGHNNTTQQQQHHRSTQITLFDAYKIAAPPLPPPPAATANKVVEEAAAAVKVNVKLASVPTTIFELSYADDYKTSLRAHWRYDQADN